MRNIGPHRHGDVRPDIYLRRAEIRIYHLDLSGSPRDEAGWRNNRFSHRPLRPGPSRRRAVRDRFLTCFWRASLSRLQRETRDAIVCTERAGDRGQRPAAPANILASAAGARPGIRGPPGGSGGGRLGHTIAAQGRGTRDPGRPRAQCRNRHGPDLRPPAQVRSYFDQDTRSSSAGNSAPHRTKVAEPNIVQPEATVRGNPVASAVQR